VPPNGAELDASKRPMSEPGKSEPRIDVASARRTVSWSSDGPVATAESVPTDRTRSTEPRVVEGGQQVSDTPPRTIAAAPQAPHDALVSDTASTERSVPRRTVAEQIVGPVANVRHEGRQSMSLRLDPPELGAVRIDAVLDGRHVSLEIRTERAEARAMVEGSLPAIRQALEDRGFVTDQLSVQLGMDTATGSADRDAERFAHPASPPSPEPKRMIAPRRRVARAPVEGLDLLV
jgi:flagellar hook-length control protein FliK